MAAGLLTAGQCASLAASEVDAADRYEIVVSYETETTGVSSSGSSSGSTPYLEYVVSQDDDCVVRGFDLEDSPERARPLSEWQMPAQVSDCRTGEHELVNVAEMEARLELFLAAMEATREVCGKHYFTWNVFKVECDPQTVLDTVKHIDLASIPLADGVPYEVPGGAGPAVLSLISQSEQTLIWQAEVAVDPEYLREEAARTDVVVGQIMGEPVSLEEALAALERQTYSGSISVRFEASPAMQDITRTIQSTMRVVDANGEIEDRSTKEITRRKRAGH